MLAMRNSVAECVLWQADVWVLSVQWDGTPCLGDTAIRIIVQVKLQAEHRIQEVGTGFGGILFDSYRRVIRETWSFMLVQDRCSKWRGANMNINAG